MDTNNPDIIKAFIATVKEYNTQRSEGVSQKLQRCLQILSTTSDRNIFDPNNADGAEFYVSLYDLMSTLDSRTGLMWCAVSVLEEACKNPSAQPALVHKYKFAPILTQLLSGHLIHDKQLKVLRLLQEFTYGVKILWQDSHLPLLISVLTKWIKDNDKSSELVSLSLGVLINVCYKNLPAVYVLRRVIDIKEFIRSILNHAKDILDIRVQAYKMLIILEEITGEVSDSEILACVTWTFKRIREAFECGSVNTMRHLVDFFKDIKESSNFKTVLLKYPSYSVDTENLLRLLESKLEYVIEISECTALLLEFVRCIVLLDVPDKNKLFEPIVKLSLTLHGINPLLNQNALQLICTVMIESRRSGNQNHLSVINLLEKDLSMLLSSFNFNDSTELENKSSITALLSLLLELSQEPSFCKRILSTLQPSMMKNYFLQMLSPNSPENDNLFDESSSALHLHGLSLISTLSLIDDNWSALFCEILQHKKLKLRLAATLFTASAEVKLQVLRLISRLGSDHRLLVELSQCMTEFDKVMSPIINTSKTNGLLLQQNNMSTNSGQYYSSPLLTLAQQNRLDQCIATVQQALANNQLGSIGTAAVLELYEYRVAAMSHTESVLQGNLQAVDNYCTQLRHRLSIMTSEMNKLLSELHNKEQSLEASQSAVTSLQRNLVSVESLLQATQNKYTQVTEDLKASKNVVEELLKELNNVKQNLRESQQQNVLLKEKIEEMENDHQRDLEKQEELKLCILNLKKELEANEEITRQKCKELKDMGLVIQNREKKIEQQETLIKGLEKSVCDKDNEIVQQQAEIAELEAMRDVIMKLTMEKEKKQGKKK